MIEEKELEFITRLSTLGMELKWYAAQCRNIEKHFIDTLGAAYDIMSAIVKYTEPRLERGVREDKFAVHHPQLPFHCTCPGTYHGGTCEWCQEVEYGE